MAAKNPPTEIYNAIVQGMLRDENWSVEDRNFEHYDTVEGVQDPDLIVMSDGDFPRAVLEGPVEFETGLYTTDETFATHSDEPPPEWIEEGGLSFRLTVTSDLLKLTTYTSLEVESINAIRKLGPKLGLSYVTAVKIKGTSKEDRDKDEGIKRIVIVILITVKYAISGRELTGG